MGITLGFGSDVALVSPWMINGTLTSFLDQNRMTLALPDRLFLVRTSSMLLVGAFELIFTVTELHDVADGLNYRE
jgi:hypothetical protein